tara:strand:+ start:3192 stop:3974 length:783 start_codon:yes stop_codon:yes gene_type:complete
MINKKYLYILRYIFYLAWCRNRVRFIKTKLGSFWIGLSTLLTIGSLAFVYSAVLQVSNKREYVIYIGLGILYWNTLAALITDFSTLLMRSRDRLLSTSINVIDVISEEYFFTLQNLFISIICVVPCLCLIYPKLIFSLFTFKAFLGFLIYLVLILLNALFISISGLISADIFQLIPVVLQLSFLLSPILYFKQTLAGKEWIYKFNPLYLPIGIVRGVILKSEDYTYLFLLKIFISVLLVTALIFRTIRKNARVLNLYVDK